MNWIRDVGLILQANGFGTLGSSLVLVQLTAKPNSLVAVVPYGGLAPRRTHNGTERRFPRFQVVVRRQDPEEAWNVAHDIRDVLRAFTQQVIGGTTYEVIEPLGEPHPLDSDTEGRTVVVCNYEGRFHDA